MVTKSLLLFFLASLNLFHSNGLPEDGIEYYLYPVDGISGDRKFLSCSADGTLVDLWFADENSGRQRWLFSRVSGHFDANTGEELAVYNIMPSDGLTSNRMLLSTTDDGSKVDLWHTDGLNLRQRWFFVKIDDTNDGLPIFHVFNIRITNSNRIYLSTRPDGTLVDLWHEDGGNGRQSWVLETAREISLVGLPVSGIAYHLYPFKGLSSNRRFLSCTPDGTKVDLWHEDAGRGRQQWILTKLDSEEPIYSLNPWDGLINTNRRYLSTPEDGTFVDLWHTIANNGRQEWYFIKIGETTDGLPIFNIISEKVARGRVFLSTTADGTKVDLWHWDANSGRQQWVVEPFDMELISVTFDVNTGNILNSVAEEIYTQTVVNETPVEQSQTLSISTTLSERSTFTYQGGFTVSIEASFTGGLPLVGETSITVGVSTTHTFTTSTTTIETTQITQEFPIVVPANTTVRAVAIVTRSELRVSYTATFRSQLTGVTTTQNGVWEGTSSSDVIYSLDVIN